MTKIRKEDEKTMESIKKTIKNGQLYNPPELNQKIMVKLC